MTTDDARPSISPQEEHEPDDPASVHCRDSEQWKRSNVGHDGNHNAKIVRVIPAATKENEVQQLQDSTMTSESIQDVINIPGIMENDYIKDEDFADIYKYIKYNMLTDNNDKN